MADSTPDVDGTYGLTAAAFEECPECGKRPVGFVTMDTPDARVLNIHVGVQFEACTVTTTDATRVVFHARDTSETEADTHEHD